MDSSDENLISAVAAGDAVAFEELVRRYERRVLNTAYRYIGDTVAAQDIAQDVFLKVWDNAGRFQRRASFSTWLYRIVVNHCLNFWAKRKRRETLPLDEAIIAGSVSGELNAEESAVTAERQRAVRAALEKLPGQQRIALVLRHYEEKSYTEISEIMGVSLSAVESLIFRARQNLKTALALLRARGEV